jgi:hypothetical protein
MENMIETAGRWFANTTFRTHMNTWLSASSKETHFKAMKQVLYLKFKDHNLFKGDQSWWTDLLKRFNAETAQSSMLDPIILEERKS